MTNTQSASDEPAHGKSSLLGVATILFTLLLLIIGGGVALYARLADGSDSDTGETQIDEESPEISPGRSDRPLRTGRRLTRTRVGQLELERTQLQNELQILTENARHAILPEDRAYVAAQTNKIERRLDEIERTLRERR
ncbi:MAG: hypothetical protein AAF196_03870 [Planctomycetota bacterium]